MRTFLAIEVIDPKILGLIGDFQNNLKLKAKKVSLENIHFTLLFLGEINQNQLSEIKTVIEKIEFPIFKIKLVGVGVFPKIQNPRIIWIGVDRDGEIQLKELAKKVEKSLLPLGFKNDKEFKSHLTIFRIKNKIDNISSILEKYAKYEFGTQVISEFKLKKSVLSSEGPTYYDLLTVRGGQ